MTDQPSHNRLLLTLPDTYEWELEALAPMLQELIQDSVYGEVSGAHDPTVTPLPELWVMSWSGPDYDRVRLFTSEEACWRHVVDYAADENVAHLSRHMSPILIAADMFEQGYLIVVQRHDYPT